MTSGSYPRVSLESQARCHHWLLLRMHSGSEVPAPALLCEHSWARRKKILSSSLSNFTLESKTIFICISISLLPHPPTEFPVTQQSWPLVHFQMKTLWWLWIDLGTSLVLQWLRVHLLVQGTWDQSLVQEDPLEKMSGYPLQYSYLENPMNRGAWHAIAHECSKS